MTPRREGALALPEHRATYNRSHVNLTLALEHVSKAMIGYKMIYSVLFESYKASNECAATPGKIHP